MQRIILAIMLPTCWMASTPPTAVAQSSDFSIGESESYRNLTVFPVLSKVSRDEDPYLTLDEGLREGTVQVSEVDDANHTPPASRRPAAQRSRTPRSRANDSDLAADPIQIPSGPRRPPASTSYQVGRSSGDVNRLIVVNHAKKPVYLMPGEVIYGGQQDRAVGEEAIIPSDGTPTPIKVYCVEHGRWASRSSRDTAAEVASLAEAAGETLDSQELQRKAAEAQLGKFVAPAGSLHKKGRLAVQDSRTQSEVWTQVGEANAASGATTRSDTFSANYTSPQVRKQIQGYVDALETSITNCPRVVGAVVAINGKVEAADVFQSTPLFRKLWPKLLKSHALDAATTVRQSEAKKVCTQADAQDFLRNLLEATVEKTSSSQGGLVVTKRESKRVVSFSAAPRDGAALGGMGAFGGVHSSGYAK